MVPQIGRAGVTREPSGRPSVAIEESTESLATADPTHGPRLGSAFYDRPDVASFGQLAVRPSHQACGFGSTLIARVERRATEQGVSGLALDTSERATDLIALYQRRGYRFVEYCQWDITNLPKHGFCKADDVAV